MLWFAWKFVPLWYQQQQALANQLQKVCCDLLENSYLCGINNNQLAREDINNLLWFAWKFVPLWYQQQQARGIQAYKAGCDLLENSYLCGINNNQGKALANQLQLWFAWKFVPLWYQQQQNDKPLYDRVCCDLLENSYLCGINNNSCTSASFKSLVVICLKIRTFVVSTTTDQ